MLLDVQSGGPPSDGSLRHWRNGRASRTDPSQLPGAMLQWLLRTEQHRVSGHVRKDSRVSHGKQELKKIKKEEQEHRIGHTHVYGARQPGEPSW